MGAPATANPSLPPRAATSQPRDPTATATNKRVTIRFMPTWILCARAGNRKGSGPPLDKPRAAARIPGRSRR